MIRKLLILIAVSVLVLAVLGGCGGRNDEPAEVVAPAEAPAEEVVVEEEAPAEEAEIVVEEGAEEAAEAPAEEEAVAEEEAPAEEAVAEEEPVAEEEVPADEAEVVEEAEAEEEGAADEAAADEAGAEEAAAEEAAAEEAEDMEVVVGEGEEEAVEGAADEAEVVEEAEAEEVAEAEGDATAEEAAEETEEGDAEAEMAESTGVVTVESARAIRDIVNERQPAFTAVSPDGSMLVYAITQGRFWNNTNSICFFTFANANRSCYEIDSNEYLGYMPSFVWSPDSSVVAFTENPIQLGFESDIWVMDAADGSMVNLTDDGVIGSWTVAERGTYALDYEPMWDEETGDLYFWRSEPTGNLAITFQLMRFPAGSEEAELVHDVSAELEGLVMTWDIEDYYLDGPSALSPDGSKVAMAIQSLDSLSEDERVGVWMLDVASGELTQMATAEDYRLAIPDWHEARARGVANQWTADSNGFVTLISSPTSRLPLIVFNYTDAETGEITPVVDFSNVESQEALMTAPEDGIPPRFYSPWTATVSPAGDKLFMLSNLAGVAGLITAPLPPVVGAEPEVAGAAESFTTMGGTRSSTSETGKVVIFGFLLTTVEE